MKNINLIDNHRKRILLRRIRDIMNELDCYDDFQYSIIDDKNNIIKQDFYALCLKDFNASKKVQELVDAGIYSFKIEPLKINQLQTMEQH